ncbi:MAG: WD40 repeat domain-containing serine/threonine protein kinase, partial [Gemmataceae bacterium]
MARSHSRSQGDSQSTQPLGTDPANRASEPPTLPPGDPAVTGDYSPRGGSLSQGTLDDVTLPSPDSSIGRSDDLPISPPGYELKPEIARGGMGIVYAARDLTFDREVAIKVMQPGMSAATFNREASITARLSHPAIPPVHAMGALPDGLPFLVMKLVRGETLDRLLSQRKNLESDHGKYLAAFEQMCQAVGYAHSQGIIHRDLKPQNVMVGAFGEVQVMDWGLARVMHRGQRLDDRLEQKPPADQEATLDDVAATVAGQVKGTPAYMAPEQARGEPVDARTDVFALGGILTAILTGKPPFLGDGARDTIVRAARADLGDTFARLDASDSDPELVALCKRCLAARAEDRPENGETLARLVASYREGVEEWLKRAEMERVRAEEERKRRRIQWGLAAATLLLLLSGGFGAVAASLWRKAEVQRDAAEDSRHVAEKAQEAESQAREKLGVFEYGGTMRVAHQEWRDANIAAMRTLLDGSDPKLRGWEWRYLNRMSDTSLLTLKGHTNHLFAASFSPDGTRVVTGSDDKTAKVWDARTGTELLTFKGHTGDVVSASFSADGTRVVTGSLDKTAKVWDAKTGEVLLTFKGNSEEIHSALFSPDGTRVVTFSGMVTKPGEAKVWDAKTGEVLLTLKGHNSPVISASFSADGTRVVTGSLDKTAKVWDAKTGKDLLTLKGHNNSVGSASFSADGTRIITASFDMTAKVWDAKTGEELFTLKGHTGYMTTASFSADGTRVVTAGFDRTAKIWDAKAKAEALTLSGHTEGVSAASFSADGTRVVTGSSDQTAKIWDVKTGSEILTLKGHSSGVSAASFSA